MNNGGEVDITAVRGGPLLSLEESTQFTGLSPEILLRNVRRRCYPIHIAKNIYFFEDDLKSLVKLYRK